MKIGRQRADVVVGNVSGIPGKAHGDGWVYLETKYTEGQERVSCDVWTTIGWR